MEFNVEWHVSSNSNPFLSSNKYFLFICIYLFFSRLKGIETLPNDCSLLIEEFNAVYSVLFTHHKENLQLIANEKEIELDSISDNQFGNEPETTAKEADDNNPNYYQVWF